MSTNWAAGLIYWWPHNDTQGRSYSLHHLHPFRLPFELAAKGGHPARCGQLNIAFSCHTFTRKTEDGDHDDDAYEDNRERRTFCPERYRLSFELPTIVRALHTRRCEISKNLSGEHNFLTIDLGQGVHYAVFLALKRQEKDRHPKVRERILAAAEQLFEQAGRLELPTIDAVRQLSKTDIPLCQCDVRHLETSN